MLIDFHAFRHHGNVCRNNQDAFLVASLDGEEPRTNTLRHAPRPGTAPFLVAVADGLGGADSGEVASRECLAAFAVTLLGLLDRQASPDQDWITQAFLSAAEGANDALLRSAEEEPWLRGMSTTFTAAMIWKDSAYLCHVGDTRAYLYRRPSLVQITQDQAFAQAPLSNRGGGTFSSGLTLARTLGSMLPVQPSLFKVTVRRGDRLLLCSDGLHGVLDVAEIEDIFSREHSAQSSLDLLLAQVLKRGGPDNLSAVLLCFEDPSLPFPRERGWVRVVPLGPRHPAADSQNSFARLWRIMTGAKKRPF